ncbi:MAG TPA: bifunctional polysaccharide deacetylase/glycosyltransferase family 2 protein [Streptosporangiaceae bacterium]|jgi:cellulose synthase/poly-beta-1,6-N-acetylglucosamine synthase-like glycosyltransferase/peptidoglycan/xylan/chitin deacetylase (PgdA/CDA1 family)|nr:bifunctional polysaccharide deacetylase/glycosyltransferase family 2 protein [Streptosporangiaceae bacterium]
MPISKVQRPLAHRVTRTPHGHWVFVALILLVFGVALLFEGYTHGVLGESPQTANLAGSHGPQGPHKLVHGGPVINATGRHPYSYRMRAKTVALTFDDGPDPTWTPKILAILQRKHVPATFFVVGAHVAANPSIVRAELAAGDEVGSHTYTHANLASASWRLPLELTLTQNALAGAAGIRTSLLRPPYSSGPDALTRTDWLAYSRAARFGYLVVLASTDTKDWAKPSVKRIVTNAMPRGDDGAIIMLHDSGGNRRETVRALPRIIDKLRSRGYRFVTVTDGLQVPPGVQLPSADAPATPVQRVIGTALVLSQQAADHTIAALAVCLVAASGMLVLRIFAITIFARRHRRRMRPQRMPPNWRPPGASVVIPAFNEGAGIAATVASMIASYYPGELEVIVVDDGSTDGTADIVRGLRLPDVRVISQANAGKPAALNRGIAEAWFDLLVLVDGDTIFARDALLRLALRMRDPDVGAVSGNTKVANRRGLLGRWQHLEYVMGFNLERRMFDVLGTIPTVPGAIGAFRRAALADVNGLSASTLAEDTDLTMAICRSGWRVVYEPRAIAWTEAPSSLRQLWRQRYRWCYGTMQSMWKHKRSVLERGPSGQFGRRCLPYLSFYQVLLPLIAPVVDLAAIYGLIFLNPVSVAGFWLGFNALQILACGYALRLDREHLKTLWALPLQQVVYRQLMYLVTIQSVMTALLGTRQRWQAIAKTGVFSGPAARRPRVAAPR